ncbi:MAG: ATP-binding cassette domain-containing protein [Patescibacteria group bacterium]
MPIIEVNNLTKKFKSLVAVNDVSFTVSQGEIFGFLGPNGAGKTTTINILTTLLQPTSGSATVNQFDVVKNKEQVRESIGLIFQDPSLDDKLSALENLKFHAWLYRVDKAVQQQRMSEMLKMVGLYSRKKDRVDTFSGGMKRRLEIARGLIHHPKVLFLDEPTIGLDPQTRNHIWEYVLQLRARENITMFLTTHYMDEAEYCDRVAIIDEGKIIALDTVANLKKLIGGDVIIIKTSDNQKAQEEIQQKWQLEAKPKDDQLMINKPGGEKFIPDLFKNISPAIESVALRQPTLNDVFLKLTGKEIRDEEVSKKDKMKRHLKMRSRMGPH